MNFVNLLNIQKGRTAFMGLAMLWVIAFHYSLLADTPLHYILGKGYLGVDIFILLSSFGLCFSLKKNASYKEFIIRRLRRIVPTWWFLITIMLVVNIVLQRNHPHNLFQIICYYSGAGWWAFHNEPFGIYYYEWYIPTLLAFYLFIPLLYKLSNRRLAILLILSIVGVLFLDYFCISPRLSLSYQRIPTFIYGILLYRMFIGQIDNKISNKYIHISSIIGAIIFLYAIVCRINNYIVICSFMFAMPLLFNMCNLLFRGRFNKVLSFIGTLTLELYLLHIYNLPLFVVMKVVGNRTLSIIITTLILVGVSYIVSYTMAFLERKMKV